MVRGVGWGALVILVAGLMAGCGGSDEKKVALLLPNQHSVRYQDRYGFKKKVNERCPECKVLYANAQGSVARQQAQAERILGEGADVLVVDPVEPHAAARIVHTAKRTGVPVVSYAHLIPGSGVDYYVGVDSEQLGWLQADFLGTTLKEAGKPRGPIVVVTLGVGGLQNVGARKRFSEGGVKIVEEYNVDELTSEGAEFSLAKREMQRAIDAVGAGGFVGVFAPNDQTAAGAIAAMEAAGIDPKAKPTTGAGATLPAVKRVLAGEQGMSTYEATWQQSASSAKVAVKLVNGDPVPTAWITDELTNGGGDIPAILWPPTAVTGENLMSTVIPYRFIKPGELCVAHYSQYCVEAGIE
ncbi:MAG: D-xylose transport system substrate-binding protein [Solirubrobacterales bacterium]|jgi:D-xylose transport system substrate-binding protein|nr:D-xylose transport system substrate-binding protein [Solirubrobacterales bacterium]